MVNRQPNNYQNLSFNNSNYGIICNLSLKVICPWIYMKKSIINQ